MKDKLIKLLGGYTPKEMHDVKAELHDAKYERNKIFIQAEDRIRHRALIKLVDELKIHNAINFEKFTNPITGEGMTRASMFVWRSYVD